MKLAAESACRVRAIERTRQERNTTLQTRFIFNRESGGRHRSVALTTRMPPNLEQVDWICRVNVTHFSDIRKSSCSTCEGSFRDFQSFRSTLSFL